ncbi:ABC transporter substrate-binding protein [Streptomyces sp. NPDC057694]|uniref:ABC transporter substrate-binding protein n=1 Tax=Streptomyces sp. NPDC057694 TaxID=3346216 RepID=UPI0036785DE3
MNIRSRRVVLPLLLGLTCAVSSACGAGGGDWLGRAPSVVVGMTDDVLATDPASGYDPGSWLLFDNVFQSLLSFPAGGTEPEPEVAEHCGFTDGQSKVYRCTLKDGIEFSNGDSLTSKDVKFSFDRLLRINDPAGPAVMFPTLGKISTPDDRTVVFHLKAPDATFPSAIASGAGSIVDSGAYDGDALRTDHQAVGSGPYELESFDKGQAVFSVNDRYKGTAVVKNGGITLKFFHSDRDALKRALLGGEVDLAYRGLGVDDIDSLEQQGGRAGVDVVEGSSAEIQHLVFNMDDPVAGRLGVRRAIAYLLNRQALVKQVYKGTAIPLYSIIPAGIVGHHTAFFDRYGGGTATDKAAAALEDEGITGKVKLTLWSTPSRYGPATDQELAAIAAQLNASGLFDADMKSVAFGQYEKDIAAGRYGVYVKGWVPDYPDPDNFTTPFFGDGNVLDNHYKNSKLTGTLIPDTAAVSDRPAAGTLFEKIQDIVADEVPVLPLWQGKQYAVVRNDIDIDGYEYCMDASTVFRFWELSKA